MPEAAIAELTVQKMRDEMKSLQGHARGRYLASVPRETWELLYQHYLSIAAISRALGVSRQSLARYFETKGVHYAHDRTNSMDRRWRILLEEIDRRTAGIVQEREEIRLNPNYDYAIFGDVHCPSHSIVWLKRLATVCEHYGITRGISAGDIINFDAISYWAQRNRGEVPKVQDELNVYEHLEQFLLDVFPDGIWLIISNHEMRLLHILKHEIQADYLFERLLRTGKWVDGEVISIGKKLRIYHPSKGNWVRPLNQANYYALSHEASVILAHTHRFAVAHSDAGRLIGLLGGLFDEKKFRYRTGRLNRYQLQNGFFLWRKRKLIPFCDGLTDWELYGCE